jgi:HSP20 family protein
MNAREKTRSRTAVAKRAQGDFTDQLIEPFSQFRNEVDRIFDSFPFRLPTSNLGRLGATAPAVEMTETSKSYKVTAELPGLDPEQLEVSFDDGVLRIAGEKRQEREENETGYRLSERTYGAFERLISLPSAADPEKIKAKFNNGVLTVTVGKNGSKQTKRSITIDKDA